MSRHIESPRPDASDVSQGSQGQGTQQWLSGARNPPRKTANRAIKPQRLIHGKRAHQERLSFMHAYNLEARLVDAAHQTHEAIMNRTHRDPTDDGSVNERGWGRGAVVHRRAAPWPFPDRERGSCTTQRGLVQCKLQNLTGQSGGAGSRQSERRQRGCTGREERQS